VERRPGDRGSGDSHGLQLGHRRQHARPAHLDHDVTHAGPLALGRVLEGHGPSHRTGRGTERRLLVQPIHLDDHAVDLVVQLVAPCLPAVQEGSHPIEVGGAHPVGVDGQTETGQQLEDFRVPLDLDPFPPGQLVAPGREPAPGGLPGVQQPDGTRRGVAGVGKLGLSLLPADPVDLREDAPRHVDLSPHLQQRRRALEPQGEPPDGPDVGRHVVPHEPVPPRHGPHQDAVLVEEGDGHAVDLELGRQPLRGMAQLPGHPGVPLLQLTAVVGVVQGEHGHRVPDLLQAGERLATDPLRGRVGGDDLGVGLLQFPELGEEPVVLQVADLGRRLHVVEAVVTPDLPAELLRTFTDLPRYAHDLLRRRGLRRRGRRFSGSGSVSPASSRRTAFRHAAYGSVGSSPDSTASV